MDSYGFEYEGLTVTVGRDGLKYNADTGLRAACAEILKLAGLLAVKEDDCAAVAEERDGYRSSLKSVLAASEAIESENRSKCSELAEKTVEIRELQAERDELYRLWLLSSKRVTRGRRLLALLDSEEPPTDLRDTILARPSGTGSATAAWRWLREQVVEPAKKEG